MNNLENLHLTEAEMKEAVTKWPARALLTYYASAVRRLAEDPMSEHRDRLLLEREVIGDEIERRLEA